MPVTWLSVRWVWTEICSMCGLTKQDIREYKMKHMRNGSSRFTKMEYVSWLRSNSKDPKKFDIFFKFYNYSMIPCVFALTFSVFGFGMPMFDKIIGYAALVVAILPFVYGVIGILYGRFRK